MQEIISIITLVKTTIVFLWGLFDAHLLKFIFLDVVVHL
jgi:hypothetical protein